MKQFEVVTVGSALKDIMFYSDDVFVVKGCDIKHQKLLAMEYGSKVPVKEIFLTYGGSAMNVAQGLHNFGIFVAPMINVGKDQMGFEIYKHLKKNKIDTSLINTDKVHHTGFSVIITAAHDKEHTIFSYKGASGFLQVNNLRNFRTKWFYVSAMMNENWVWEMEKIVRQTKRGVKIAWNPGSLQLSHEKAMAKFLPHIELLILNKDEAMELACQLSPRIKKANLANSKFLLKEIKALGPQKVVITQGAKGAMAIDENNKFYYHPAQSEQKRVVETVGAGDAFSAGLVAGLVRWEDFDAALKLGIKNGASVVRHIGAQNGLLKMKL